MTKNNGTKKLSALAFGALMLSGCMDGHDSRYGVENLPANFSSEGERLYFTGISSSG